MTPTAPREPSGTWDSIHVFETTERGRQAHYKLTSTITLQLLTKRGGESDLDEHTISGMGLREKKGMNDGWKRDGEVSLSGSMTRQVG
jgi:capping protein beta